MHQWFRLYSELLEDPKAQKLPPEIFKHWINLLCLASRGDGLLPPIPDVAFALRLSEDASTIVLTDLAKRGLIEKKSGIYRPHNWAKRQYKSDVSTDRVRAFRKRFGNVAGRESETVSETPSDTDSEADTDSDTEQSRTEEKKPAVSLNTYGEFGHVKLTGQEHAKLKAELNGSLEHYIDRFDRWAEEEPRKTKNRKPYLTISNWFRRYGPAPKNGGHHVNIPANETAAERRNRKNSQVANEIRERLNRADGETPAD